MIKDLEEIEFIQTCGACPEQYDAYFKDHYVGYLRLRHGYFRVSIGETTLFDAYPKGDGIFEHEEREKYLKKARKAIKKFYNEKETATNRPTNTLSEIKQ